MKTVVLTLFLYFSLFVTCHTYAANTSTAFNYPATSGTYEKIIVNGILGTGPFCQNIVLTWPNAGLIYMDTGANTGGTNNMLSCIYGSSTPVPYSEECYNRIYPMTGATCSVLNTPPPSPACQTINGLTFVQGTINGSNADTFTPSVGHSVCSIVCCSPGSNVMPT